MHHEVVTSSPRTSERQITDSASSVLLVVYNKSRGVLIFKFLSNFQGLLQFSFIGLPVADSDFDRWALLVIN